MFVKKFSDDGFIILLLFINDMLIVEKNMPRINDFKKQLCKSFAMKDVGAAKQILGMNILRDRNGKNIWVSQGKYIEKVL